MPTISDVAKKAGVSKMTVSRTINNSGYVKAETRNSINKIIEEMQFRPSMIAKSLATQQSHIIAYVMLNLADPYHTHLYKGLEIYCYNHGYTALICDAYSKKREQEYINMLIERSIDGAVFHHLDITQKQLSQLKEAGVTCLFIDNEKDYSGISSVNTNDYLGGKMAVDYLASKGHTRIGCIHGVLKHPGGNNIPYEDTFQFEIWRQRTQGFLDRMEELNLDSSFLFQGNGLDEMARVCMPSILDAIINLPKPLTAVYCENDTMAVALLNTMLERGMRVPDDLAIIGMDGVFIGRLLHPYLTTISQPKYELGYKAAEIIIEQIEKKIDFKKIILDPELVLGETA